MELIGMMNILQVTGTNLLSIFNPQEMISYGGLLIIFLAVYAQTGLFFCFFIPSSAFMFTGGMLIATGQLEHDLFVACSCLILAAVAGSFSGYFFGRKTGPLLYRKKDSRFFKQQHLRTAEFLYKKYGHFALTVGLLFPILRTFTPIIAGMIRMDIKRFGLLVFIGALIWVAPFVSAGYLVGSIPALKDYLNYIVLAVIVAFTTPALIRISKEFKKTKEEMKEEMQKNSEDSSFNH